MRPKDGNGNAVILLHGHTDNRMGTIGYAELLLRHHYLVLMPDARAHGASGGALGTYGLLESEDLRRWHDWLEGSAHPRCIYGFGESMGAAQLLQSLRTEQRFCAVGAESPFTDLRELAFDRIGQRIHTGPLLTRTLARPGVEFAFLYARWRYGLDLGRVSPVEAAMQSKVPLLLIHGMDDRNIPIRHSRKIASLDPAALLWEVPSTQHCSAIVTAPEEFERRVIGWFQAHPVPRGLTLDRHVSSPARRAGAVARSRTMGEQSRLSPPPHVAAPS
ncbi:MAG TPA: alpha/beta fold hydrolase [Thermoanaerobaculia bacterium]|nr:alpha/beta fold hydrolase [Thermoanaerobaculia bacterium]